MCIQGSLVRHTAAFSLSDVVILETSKAGCCLSIKVINEWATLIPLSGLIGFPLTTWRKVRSNLRMVMQQLLRWSVFLYLPLQLWYVYGENFPIILCSTIELSKRIQSCEKALSSSAAAVLQTHRDILWQTILESWDDACLNIVILFQSSYYLRDMWGYLSTNS